MTPAELRRATASIVPTAELAVTSIVSRCLELEKTGGAAPRRSRGRGSQLGAVEQLAVMFYGILNNSPIAIARVMGMDPRTVRRLLQSPHYRKFYNLVVPAVLHRM